MHKTTYTFSERTVDCYFNASVPALDEIARGKRIVIITDRNLYGLYPELFSRYPVISFPAGEAYKNQQTVDQVIEELIRLEAGKDSMLVGIGGGVVTDITGFAAAIYMRGVSFGLVPTTILAMVDAAIGGKNGIDVGVYKNMVGTVRQPDFILYDYSFLRTLPFEEWVNGFAEVVKHACIKDARLFSMLEGSGLDDFRANEALLAELIEKNVTIKTTVAAGDEYEKGERKLLNFGHTIGHAIENLHGIPHGHAVSIGMAAACSLSVLRGGLPADEARKVSDLLSAYHLPVNISTDHDKVFEVLKMDKKRTREEVDFIMISRIGEAFINPVPLEELKNHLKGIL